MDSVKSENSKSWVNPALSFLGHEELADIILSAGGDIEKVKRDIVTKQHVHHNPLRQLRKRFGFTQGEVAENCRISWNTCANYENGKHSPSLSCLVHYAERLLLLVEKENHSDSRTEELVKEYLSWYLKLRSLKKTDKKKTDKKGD